MTMFKRAVTVAHVLPVAIVAFAGLLHAAEWESLGPAPITNGPYTGRVSAIVCSATNPDLYYAAGADGGVWRTDDGGTTWRPLTDHLPRCAIGALALDPQNEDVVYAGSGEANFASHSRYGAGLYKSTDGGETWADRSHPEMVYWTKDIIIDPHDKQQNL